MTTIELQQWRESFIERYLNKIDDMETVLKIEKYMKPNYVQGECSISHFIQFERSQ